MSTHRSLAEVTAGVANAISTYTQALDDGRTDDIVAMFCPDGTCDMPGLGRHVGHEAIREAYGRWKPRRPQRHLVLNTVISEWHEQEAHASSDMVFLLKAERGWTVAVVGRYHDVLHADGDTWRFHSRVAEFVEESRDEDTP